MSLAVTLSNEDAWRKLTCSLRLLKLVAGYLVLWIVEVVVCAESVVDKMILKLNLIPAHITSHVLI